MENVDYKELLAMIVYLYKKIYRLEHGNQPYSREPSSESIILQLKKEATAVNNSENH